MKTSLSICMLLLSTIVSTFSSNDVYGQTADVQFIHNSADASLDIVDIWVDGLKVVDNQSFRSASDVIPIGLSGSSTIHISDSGSVDTNNSLFQWSGTLMDSSAHQFIFQGLQNTSLYNPFQPLELLQLDGTPDSAGVEGNTDVRWVNGVTDGGNLTLDEIKLGFGSMLQGFGYGQVALNESYTTSNYRVECANNTGVLGQFELDLSSFGLEDRSVTVVFSGFEAPEDNAGGPSIQLIAYERDGTKHTFEQSTALVQWIHNSPDPSIPELDIYQSSEPLLESLSFRAASGYLAVPSGVSWNIRVSKAGEGNVLNESEQVFEPSKSYVAIIAGQAETGFAVEQPLSIEVHPSRREAQLGLSTDVLFFNGSPDFSNVRIFENSALDDVLFNTNSFGEFSGYNALPYTDYRLELLGSGSNTLIATYDLILSLYDLGGEAVTLMTSGYRDTTSNQNGPELGLWFARSRSGLMIELPLAVGIDETRSPIDDLKVFPQPSKDEVQISSKESLDQVEIFDMHGRKIYSVSPQTNQSVIRTTQWSNGIYILHARSHSGEMVSTKITVAH